MDSRPRSHHSGSRSRSRFERCGKLIERVGLVTGLRRRLRLVRSNRCAGRTPRDRRRSRGSALRGAWLRLLRAIRGELSRRGGAAHLWPRSGDRHGHFQRRPPTTHVDGARRGQRDPIAELLPGRVRNEDVYTLDPGQLLQPRSDVHCVADDGVVAALRRPDVAQDTRAGVDPDTTRSGGSPRPPRSWLSAASASRMATAHRTARDAWSGCATGAPKYAISPSPRYLSSVPPCAKITSTVRSKNVFKSATTSGAGSFGERGEVPQVAEENGHLANLAGGDVK